VDESNHWRKAKGDCRLQTESIPPLPSEPDCELAKWAMANGLQGCSWYCIDNSSTRPIIDARPRVSVAGKLNQWPTLPIGNQPLTGERPVLKSLATVATAPLGAVERRWGKGYRSQAGRAVADTIRLGKGTGVILYQ